MWYWDNYFEWKKLEEQPKEFSIFIHSQEALDTLEKILEDKSWTTYKGQPLTVTIKEWKIHSNAWFNPDEIMAFNKEWLFKRESLCQ